MEEEFCAVERAQGGWERAFQDLAQDSPHFPCRVAHLPLNRTLNRYRDVSPFDESRVKLQKGDNDYINASLVCVPRADRKYILTQGPLPHTCGHFWQMVWEQGSRAVVMLNRLVENNSIKCERYWPLPEHPEMIFDDTGVRVVLRRERERRSFTTRRLELEFLPSGERREVLHFHYTAWPDFGVPSSPACFRAFLRAVRASGALQGHHGPAVVHCSAGIGRSGSFCLVDACLVLLSERGEVDARAELLAMRRARMGLIQTADQLRFSYLALLGDDARCQDDDSDGEDDDDAEMLRLTPLPPPPNTPPLPPPRRSFEPTLPPFFPPTPEDERDTPGFPAVPPAEPAGEAPADGRANGRTDGPRGGRGGAGAAVGPREDARGIPRVGDGAGARGRLRADSKSRDDADADGDRRVDGEADGRADGEADGHADGRADGRADGEADGRADGEADGHADGDADGRTDGDVDGRAGGRGLARPGEGETGQGVTVVDARANTSGGGGGAAAWPGDADGKPRLRAVGRAERQRDRERENLLPPAGGRGVGGRTLFPLLLKLAAVILPALLFAAYRAFFGQRR